MIPISNIKNGMTIKYKGSLYQVLEFQHVKPGKGPAFVRTKLRNLDTKSIQDFTFNTNEKFEKAVIDKRNMQYLYAEGDTYFFMDLENYEQLEVQEKQIEDQLKFLIPNLTVQLIMNEGRIMDVNLPEKINIKITQCEPGLKGDTKSGGDKTAELETGHTIRVPLFIEAGEEIIVNTATGQYVSRS